MADNKIFGISGEKVSEATNLAASINKRLQTATVTHSSRPATFKTPKTPDPNPDKLTLEQAQHQLRLLIQQNATKVIGPDWPNKELDETLSILNTILESYNAPLNVELFQLVQSITDKGEKKVLYLLALLHESLVFSFALRKSHSQDKDFPLVAEILEELPFKYVLRALATISTKTEVDLSALSSRADIQDIIKAIPEFMSKNSKYSQRSNIVNSLMYYLNIDSFKQLLATKQLVQIWALLRHSLEAPDDNYCHTNPGEYTSSQKQRGYEISQNLQKHLEISYPIDEQLEAYWSIVNSKTIFGSPIQARVRCIALDRYCELAALLKPQEINLIDKLIQEILDNPSENTPAIKLEAMIQLSKLEGGKEKLLKLMQAQISRSSQKDCEALRILAAAQKYFLERFEGLNKFLIKLFTSTEGINDLAKHKLPQEHWGSYWGLKDFRSGSSPKTFIGSIFKLRNPLWFVKRILEGRNNTTKLKLLEFMASAFTIKALKFIERLSVHGGQRESNIDAENFIRIIKQAKPET